MTRLALPILVLLAAAFIALQNGDGDGEFWLLPYVEVLPWVGRDLAARGSVTWQIIAGLGVVSLGVQAWSWRLAALRRRRWDDQEAAVDALRTWTERYSWEWATAFTEEAGLAGGERPAPDG